MKKNVFFFTYRIKRNFIYFLIGFNFFNIF